MLTTLGIVHRRHHLLAIIGIIQGLNASFESQLANLGTNTLYVSSGTGCMLGRLVGSFRNRQSITLAHWRAVDRESHLAVATSPRIVAERSGRVHGGVQLSKVDVIGAETEYLDVAGGTIAAGRFLTEDRRRPRRPVAVARRPR